MAHPSQEVTVFAPATVANLGLGFDILGLALSEPGDTVVARRVDGDGVTIAAITGDGGRLPLQAERNTAGIAAIETLRHAGTSAGIEIEVHKRMPLGSGLGSSAASAAAAAYATNLLLGSPLRKQQLVPACIEAEATVAGRHADNVAPSLLGGLLLIRALDPLDIVRLPVPKGLTVVVVTPDYELLTRDARQALPQHVGLADLVRNTANIAALVSACYSGDLSLLSRCVPDEVVTPRRAALIPGGAAVISAALEAGALGSSISGSGPSIFALCHSRRCAEEVGDAMVTTFAETDMPATLVVSEADCPGARTL